MDNNQSEYTEKSARLAGRHVLISIQKQERGCARCWCQRRPLPSKKKAHGKWHRGLLHSRLACSGSWSSRSAP